MNEFGELSADRQILFRQRLLQARSLWLIDALQVASSVVDPVIIKRQILDLAPAKSLQALAKAGIRDEHVFAVPALLEQAPSLLGYYRLLLGVPQKTFYSASTRLQMFKSMEAKGTLNERQRELLWDLCRFLSGPLSDLIDKVSPGLTHRDIQELPLITLGSQLQGSHNNLIGQAATAGIFATINEIIRDFIVLNATDKCTLTNSAGRTVTIQLAGDPDVAVIEQIGKSSRKTLAIEIKGGLDKSNAHNRAGEAEKSHQKARTSGYLECWTIISKSQLDMEQLRLESPTTDSWFDLTEILAREGEDWDAFKLAIVYAVGIPLA